MITMKHIILTILALCSLLPLLAQNTTRNDSLMSRELMLEREYNPTIRDAVKLSRLPELREPKAPGTKVEFSNYSTPFSLQPKIFSLSPQAYLTNLNYSKYRGYLTAGISSLLDINGDLGYQILNSDKDRLNIFFSHRSSRSNVTYLQDLSDADESEKQKFKINDNWGGLNYMHNFGWIKLLADAKYTNSAFNYYGCMNPLKYPVSQGYGYSIWLSLYEKFYDRNTNQNNSMFEAKIGIAADKPNELNYKINLGYTNFGQKYANTINEEGNKENRILIDADIHKLFSSTMGIGISGAIKTYSYKHKNFSSISTEDISNYFTYALNPYFYLEDEYINLMLGAKMDVEVGGRGKITFSPAIKFNFYPNEQLMLYMLAEGGRKDNSQYNMFYENRYVDPTVRVIDSRSPLDATVGIKFLPVSTMSLDIFGGYKITKDEHFYYPNFGDKFYIDLSTPVLAGNWITPVYQDANTFKLGADLKYSYQDVFEFGLKGTYYNWTITSEQETQHYSDNPASSTLIPYEPLQIAWNKPSFETKLNVAYNSPWWPFRVDLSYLGAYDRKATETPFRTEMIKMKNIHDLSLKGTYFITPNFSAYLSANNLLFSKYDFWWGYPAQGFNIMGGLSVLF